MNIACPIVNPCPEVTQYENLSAEAPDSDPFFGSNFGNPQDPPGLGSDWQTWSCLGWCESMVDQAAADQCAANNQLICLSNNSNPGGGGPGDGGGPAGGGGTGQAPGPQSPTGPFGSTTQTPGGTTTGSGVFPPPRGQLPTPTFSSGPVTCKAKCPDGSEQSYTLPAGYVVAATQVTADRLAAALCPALAQQNLSCPCKLKDFACLAVLYDEICSPVIGGMSPPLLFSGSGFPPGINVSSASPAFANSASVFGTPTQPGDFTGKLVITDAGGKTVNQTVPITVLGLTNAALLPDPIADTGYSEQLPDAYCETAYSCQLTTAGGVTPITFSIDPVMAPDWVTVSAGGMITGTPQASDVGLDFHFDVDMTDSAGHSCAQTVHIVVKCTVPPPPAATLCTYYAEQLTSCPITSVPSPWSGTAPPGMTLDPDGVLHGKPTSLGANAFNVTIALDNGDTCLATVILNVLPDGTGIPSAIKDIVWVPTTVYGSGSSSMTGGSGAVSATGAWNNATCDWGASFERVDSKFKNCSAGPYTAHIAVNWTLPDTSCTPNPPGPVHHPYGIIKIWFGSYGAPASVLLLNCGDAALGTPTSGSASVDVTVPLLGNSEILIDVTCNGGSTLTANMTITPATPP